MDKETYDFVQLISSVATSVGTVGAVIASLFFSMRDRRQRLKIVTDIVYECLDANGRSVGYVISQESATEEVILARFQSYTLKLRITAINAGSVTQYINAFYFYILFGNEPNLFIDHTIAKSSRDIHGPLHPGEEFSMLLDPKVLKFKTVQGYFNKTMFARFRFRIAVETTLGRSFRNSISRTVRNVIQAP